MFQPAVIMSRLTTACCTEFKDLGVIPETDEEYLSDEETESTVSHVGESILSKTSKGGTSKSFWQKGIKWVVLQTAGLNHRINYLFNEPCRVENILRWKST